MNRNRLPPLQRSQSDDSISLLEPDPPFWTKTSWLQLGYTVWVNMTVLGTGLLYGFPAVALPQMEEKESLITVSQGEGAWIASILTLSSPIGSFLCGYLMDQYGRKLVLIVCEIPIALGWFYIALASSAKDIIIGRLITGVGLGMAMAAPRAYINEISLPNMRGVLGALPNLFVSIGLTVQAVFGSFLHWYFICYICGFYSIAMMIFKVCLPDTPYFLLLKASPSNAKTNLRRFRSSRFDVDAELAAMNDFRKENHIRSLSTKEQISVAFKPASCKPFAIASAYVWLMQLSGINVVIMWSVEMLQSSNLSMDIDVANVVLGLPRIFFGVLTSILLFKVKRRVMAMISAIGVGVSAIAFGTFLYFYEEKSICPLLIFCAYLIFGTLGFTTLPYLYIFELIPLQVRGLLSGLCITQLNLLMFALNKLYPYTRDSIGFGNTMVMYGIFSLLGAAVLYFILPETKGLTLQEIEEFFNARRPTLVSQRELAIASRANFRHSMTSMRSDHQMKPTTFQHTRSNEKIESHLKDYITSRRESVSSVRFDVSKANENESKDKATISFKEPKDSKDSDDYIDPKDPKDHKDPRNPKDPHHDHET